MSEPTSAVIFTVGCVDDFNGPWESLSLDVRQRWFTLAGVLERVTSTPGWAGALVCIEPVRHPVSIVNRGPITDAVHYDARHIAGDAHPCSTCQHPKGAHGYNETGGFLGCNGDDHMCPCEHFTLARTGRAATANVWPVHDSTYLQQDGCTVVEAPTGPGADIPPGTFGVKKGGRG